MPALRTPAVVSHSLLYQCKLPLRSVRLLQLFRRIFIGLPVSCTRLALVHPLSVISPPTQGHC